MPTALLILVKAVNGGLFVALFALVGEILQPKRFAGIFGASPAVALGNLLVIAFAKGDASARNAAAGMIAGAVALTVACAVAIPAIRRWGAVWGSVLLWIVWIVVGAAAGVPVAGGASAGSEPGLPAGRRVSDRQKSRRTADDNGRLFTVDFGSLREISPAALALRFAYGAAISSWPGWSGSSLGSVPVASCWPHRPSSRRRLRLSRNRRVAGRP